MAFTSFSFLLFAGLVIAAYYLVPKRFQWWVLLIASYVFYLTADVRYLVFIVLTTVTTYIKEKLPRYMVPNVVRQLDEMPFTPNGKIDRNGLKMMYENK